MKVAANVTGVLGAVLIPRGAGDGETWASGSLGKAVGVECPSLRF